MQAFWSVKEAGGGGPKWPTERKRSLDTSIFIQTQQAVPDIKADIFS